MLGNGQTWFGWVQSVDICLPNQDCWLQQHIWQFCQVSPSLIPRPFWEGETACQLPWFQTVTSAAFFVVVLCNWGIEWAPPPTLLLYIHYYYWEASCHPVQMSPGNMIWDLALRLLFPLYTLYQQLYSSCVHTYMHTHSTSTLVHTYMHTHSTGRLNWWATTGKLPRLEPLATSGDGNCLLHAASLYMWGFHDRELILRTALHRVLTDSLEKEGIHRRWKYQTQLRNLQAGGLTFSPKEWEGEWSDVIRIATNRPRQQPTTASLRRYCSLRLRYESLEEIHIFALAHVLRRTVIVIADKVLKDVCGEDLAPIYFGGIYLPLDTNPTACYKSPVVLAYDASHFSPLVAKQEPQQSTSLLKQKQPKYACMGGRKDFVIPLVTPEGELLPVQFVFDPENKNVDEKWSKMEYNRGEFPDEIVQLLESYLNVRWIQLDAPSLPTGKPERSDMDDYDHLLPLRVPKVRFPAACITLEAQPIYQKDLIEKYLGNVREQYKEDRERRKRAAEERSKWEEDMKRQRTVPCKGKGCDMFGTALTDNLCSVCYHKLQAQGSWRNGDGNETQRPPQKPDSFDDPRDPLVLEATDSDDQPANTDANTEAVELNATYHNKKTPDSTEHGQNRSPAKKSKPFSATTDALTGFVKKIQNLPRSVSVPAKSKKASTSGGYTRDSIQPIGYELTQSANDTTTNTKCASPEYKMC